MVAINNNYSINAESIRSYTTVPVDMSALLCLTSQNIVVIIICQCPINNMNGPKQLMHTCCSNEFLLLFTGHYTGLNLAPFY